MLYFSLLYRVFSEYNKVKTLQMLNLDFFKPNYLK